MFTRKQALSCGYSPERIRTELKNGRWLVVVDGVYRLVGSPGGWNARVWAALLAAGDGAVLGGRPAGRLHRIDGVPAYDRLAVVVPRSRRPRLSTGALVERSPLSRADVTHQRGIPVLSPARTVADLARRESLDIAVRIVGDALRSGIVLPTRLGEQLEAARGRDGIGRARAAVAFADPVLESVIEAELLRLIDGAGVRAVPQFEVFHQGMFVARLDFAIEDLRLGLEADGYGVHSLRPAFERDRERNAILQLAGWIVLSFTAEQIRRRPDWVRDVIRRIVARRRAELSKIGDAWCG